MNTTELREITIKVMREVIIDMLHDGYDITELKGIVDDILYAEKILNDNE